MGGQGIERREILRFIGIASVAATFPGFQRWAFACSADHPQVSREEAPVPPYKPLFFSSDHYRLVEHIAELIIPAEGTPGAREAGVAEFVDFMVANRVAVSPRCEIRSTQDAIRQGDDAQAQFIVGLDWINAHSKSEFASHFLDATPQQQAGLLEELAYKAKFKPTTEMGRDFFQLMRDYTVVGYYTTKIGLQSLGYPGLRTAWPSMPGCTHLDDPEHLHLRKAADVGSQDRRSAR
jgi:gluconate 2-dehydrogenase gamma chain